MFGALWFDRNGKPLASLEAAKLMEDKKYRTVGYERLDDGTVISTVWLGINHAFTNDRLLIFETMVLGPDGDAVEQRRYSTEADAERGHRQALMAWRSITNDEPVAPWQERPAPKLSMVKG